MKLSWVHIFSKHLLLRILKRQNHPNIRELQKSEANCKLRVFELYFTKTNFNSSISIKRVLELSLSCFYVFDVLLKIRYHGLISIVIYSTKTFTFIVMSVAVSPQSIYTAPHTYHLHNGNYFLKNNIEIVGM